MTGWGRAAATEWETITTWLHDHWLDAVPAWVGVILAAVFGIQAWRSSKKAEGEARAAQESAAAAKKSADAAERAATAQEGQLALAQDQAEVGEETPWQIRKVGHVPFGLSPDAPVASYYLRNCGQRPKRNVAVDTPMEFLMTEESPTLHWDSIAPNQRVLIGHVAKVTQESFIVQWSAASAGGVTRDRTQTPPIVPVFNP